MGAKITRATLQALFIGIVCVMTPAGAADDADPNTIFTADHRAVDTDQAMGARCAVSADFDGDGRIDLVSASSNDNAVSWFQNEGGDPPTSNDVRPNIETERGMDTVGIGNYTASEIQQSQCAMPEKELPPPDYNYLTNIRPVGLTFVAIATACALICIIWTQMHRKDRVVRASQPPFLRLICIGCLMMVSSIIPLSVDDSIASPELCSKACMAFPWLLSTGFTISFAGLFSKTWRLAKLYHTSRPQKRVKGKAKDAMTPFLVLMMINCVLMLAWRLTDPLIWIRTELDENNQSHGYCRSEGGTSIIFVALIIIVNLGALIMGCVQAFRARKISLEEFSESTYVFLTMGSLLQALIIGAPLLALVHGNDVATYFLWSAMIFVVSTSILGLMFIPKMLLVMMFIPKMLIVGKKEIYRSPPRPVGRSKGSSQDSQTNVKKQSSNGTRENQSITSEQSGEVVINSDHESCNGSVATGTF